MTLKIVSYDIVFQEIPGEVTLALNISGCPNRCQGCHSQHLQEDIGTELSWQVIEELLDTYGKSVSCVCFMGGDGNPQQVARLSMGIKKCSTLKTAWYSGCEAMPCELSAFDYVKVGAYRQELGDLRQETTNQRLYRVMEETAEDITHLLRSRINFVH